MNIWENVKDPRTGKDSLTENIKPRLIAKECPKDKHYFILYKPADRSVTCRKCGIVHVYIPGVWKLEDGKIDKVKV